MIKCCDSDDISIFNKGVTFFNEHFPKWAALGFHLASPPFDEGTIPPRFCCWLDTEIDIYENERVRSLTIEDLRALVDEKKDAISVMFNKQYYEHIELNKLLSRLFTIWQEAVLIRKHDIPFIWTTDGSMIVEFDIPVTTDDISFYRCMLHVAHMDTIMVHLMTSGSFGKIFELIKEKGISIHIRVSKYLISSNDFTTADTGEKEHV